MADQAERSEGPHEERSVGNGVRNTETAERSKRIKFVAESVGPVSGGPACAEASALVARRRRDFDRRAVVQRVVVDIQAETKKCISDSVSKPVCLSRGCRCRRPINEIKRQTGVGFEMTVYRVAEH